MDLEAAGVPCRPRRRSLGPPRAAVMCVGVGTDKKRSKWIYDLDS